MRISARWMKCDAAKLRPIQRLFCRVQRVKTDGQKRWILEAVNAIEKRKSEQRPVVSIALVMVGALQRATRNHVSNPITIAPVTAPVICQPWSFMLATANQYCVSSGRRKQVAVTDSHLDHFIVLCLDLQKQRITCHLVMKMFACIFQWPDESFRCRQTDLETLRVG